MKLKEFKYTKSGEVAPTDRKVLILHETDDFIEGIDFTHLTPSEASAIEDLVVKFEEAVAAVTSRAYRRFKKGQIV